jgi:hypothetical protein
MAQAREHRSSRKTEAVSPEKSIPQLLGQAVKSRRIVVIKDGRFVRPLARLERQPPGEEAS